MGLNGKKGSYRIASHMLSHAPRKFRLASILFFFFGLKFGDSPVVRGEGAKEESRDSQSTTCARGCRGPVNKESTGGVGRHEVV